MHLLQPQLFLADSKIKKVGIISNSDFFILNRFIVKLQFIDTISKESVSKCYILKN